MPGAAALVSRTPSSLKKCRVPLHLFQKLQKTAFFSFYMQFGPIPWSDMHENFSNCPKFNAKHNVFYAPSLQNARGGQKWRKTAFLRTSRAIARAARARSKIRQRQFVGIAILPTQSKFRPNRGNFATQNPHAT